MLGLDSNDLIRFLTRDDPTQFELARKLFERADDGTLFLSTVVLVEVNWVLRRVYRRPRIDVLEVLDELMDTRQFTIDQRELVIGAIASARAVGCDFSDALIALQNEALGCNRTATFDEKAIRLEQMISVDEVTA